MAAAAQAPRFEDNKGLIHLQAKQGFKWAQGAGCGLDYDDMFQVASTAFCIAANGYDPETGMKFSAYYTKVAFSEFRREIGLMTGVKNLNEEQRAEIAARKEENARRRSLALPELPDMNYGLAPMLFGDMVAGDDESEKSAPFESSLVSGCMNPEEQVELRQIVNQATANLSPLAQLIVDWLIDLPDELVRELAGQRAHADECAASGQNQRRPRGLLEGITIGSICKFLQMIGDLPRREILLVEDELKKVSEAIEKEM